MMSPHRTARTGPRAEQRRRARPQLELLEERNLLSAFNPLQVRHAYGFDQVPYNGAGQTIAIVDAYDDPSAAADLSKFSTLYGLPQANFTKATPQGMPAA